MGGLFFAPWCIERQAAWRGGLGQPCRMAKHPKSDPTPATATDDSGLGAAPEDRPSATPEDRQSAENRSPAELGPADNAQVETADSLRRAQYDVARLTESHNERVVDLSRANQRIAELEATLRSIVPGKVLEEDGEFETVIVRRKKVARPTGRIIPRANIRLTVLDSGARDTLRTEGARLNPEGHEHAHVVMLTPSHPNQPAQAYTVPVDVFQQVIASGAATEELR